MDDWSHFASFQFTPGTQKYKGYFDTGNSKVDTITTLFKSPSCEWSSFKQALGVLYLVFEEIECLIPKVKITIFFWNKQKQNLPRNLSQ